MKKAIYFMLLFLINFAAYPAIFDGYDFSFFESVAESIAVSDEERIGLDYTGYGYLGDMTTGIFLRLGFEAPYSTLLNTFEDIVDSLSSNDSDDGHDQGTMDNNELESNIKDYTFLVALGPSFRRMVSPTLSWYMGLGVKLQIDYTTTSLQSSTDTVLKYIAATDVDLGFRITADIHTTLRIGAYLTRPLFTLTQSFSKHNGVESESSFSFAQNIYPDLNTKDDTIKCAGYIALGHTYTSYLNEVPMRYVITTREMGKGRLEVM